MMKIFILFVASCTVSSCSFAKGNKSLVVSEKKVFKTRSMNAKVVGLLQSSTIVDVLKETKSVLKNNEVIIWYKIKKNGLTGWISDYNLIKFPSNGSTAVTMNPNKWVIYKDSEFSVEQAKYKPNELISIIDAIETENGINFEIIYNEISGWVHESQINIEDNYHERLKSLYNLNSFNMDFSALDKIVDIILGQKKYSISTKNDLIKYKVSFDDNIILVQNRGNKFWVQEMTILDDFEFLYSIKNGMNIDYVVSILGSDYSITNSVYKYIYSENLFANPLYSISFHTNNGYIEKIVVSYYLFD